MLAPGRCGMPSGVSEPMNVMPLSASSIECMTRFSWLGSCDMPKSLNVLIVSLPPNTLL